MKDAIEINNEIVYFSDIVNICDSYINTLQDETAINKSAAFNGLLLYLKSDSKINKIINNIKNDKGRIDYNALDIIFKNIYLPICYRYLKTPTIQQFCVFVGINNGFITQVKNGNYYKNDYGVNKTSNEIVKTWFEVCESALYGKALEENSISAIFGLKAAHGWKEANELTITSRIEEHETAAEIAARHQAAQLPAMPEI